MTAYIVTGTSPLIDAQSPQEAVDRAQETSGWHWEARDPSNPFSDTDHRDRFVAFLQTVANAAAGDSNDEEIDLLREALDEALQLLGLTMPEVEYDD